MSKKRKVGLPKMSKHTKALVEQEVRILKLERKLRRQKRIAGLLHGHIEELLAAARNRRRQEE